MHKPRGLGAGAAGREDDILLYGFEKRFDLFIGRLSAQRHWRFFLLPVAGTKEKAKQKENTVEENFDLCGRRRETRGAAPPQTFEKA